MLCTTLGDRDQEGFGKTAGLADGIETRGGEESLLPYVVG